MVGGEDEMRGRKGGKSGGQKRVKDERKGVEVGREGGRGC